MNYVQLSYWIKSKLEEYDSIFPDEDFSEIDTENPIIYKLKTKLEYANKVISELRCSLQNIKDDETITKDTLSQMIPFQIMLGGTVHVDQVPKLAESQTVISTREFLEFIQLYQACKTVLDYLKRKQNES